MAHEIIDRQYQKLVSAWLSLSQEERDRRIGSFALSYAYHSGKIENDQITYHDTHEVFENGRVIAYTGDVRTLFEIQNLKASWEWARPLAVPGLRFTERLVLRAHELLTFGTYDTARWENGERPGSYKRGDYVVGVNVIGCDAEEVPAAVAELLDEVNPHLDDEKNALTVAGYLHAKLVEIHPFADGNGRVARLLMNMVLMAMTAPPIAIREGDRMSYYGALDAFHGEGDLDPFLTFLQSESVMTWAGAMRLM